jgi:hypothetical protein
MLCHFYLRSWIKLQKKRFYTTSPKWTTWQSSHLSSHCLCSLHHSHRTHYYPWSFHWPAPSAATDANREAAPPNAWVPFADDQPILNHPLLTHGDLIVQGLMHKATNTILDFQVVNLGAVHLTVNPLFPQHLSNAIRTQQKYKKHKRRHLHTPAALVSQPRNLLLPRYLP